jgi:hypothetical protein
LAVLKQVFFDYLQVYELLKEPSWTLQVRVHVSFQVFDHWWKIGLVLSSLHNVQVVCSCKFENCQLTNKYVFSRVQLIQR